MEKKGAWFIVICWLILASISAIYLHNAGHPFKIGGITDPQSESAVTEQKITQKLAYGDSRLYILFSHDQLKATHATFRKEVNAILNKIDDFDQVHHIISPYDQTRQIAKNKRAAYAIVVMNNNGEITANLMDELRQFIGKPKNLHMMIGGHASYIADVNRLSADNLIKGELIALPICIFALIIVFRGIVAALLPILSGVLSIVVILSLLHLLGWYFELTVFVLNIATMLGLGLCLDYTLLITYRFREELTNQISLKQAIRITLRTAGKAIFFSGLTVFISMSSLLFFPVNVLYSIGMGGVVVVCVVLLSALTFLPALLKILGEKVNALALPILKKDLSLQKAQTNPWFRFTMVVMRHPFLFFIPTFLFLLCLGYPFLHVKLSRSDATILPTRVESRAVLDKFKSDFDANELSPITLLVKSKSKMTAPNNIGALYDFTQTLKNNQNVKRVASIVTLNDSYTKPNYKLLYQHVDQLNENEKSAFKESTKGRYTVVNVISKYPPSDDRSLQLVRDIRNNHSYKNLSFKVTGASAIIIDTIESVYYLFFIMMIVISIITYVVLLILLRSLILPLKAIMMNYLSLFVCYGMLVYIFQEGHFAKFLGFQALGNTDLNIPVLLFFSLFGLSMDYEVFLLTRIREFYLQTRDNTLSVALGVERSARIITSAALIVIIVAGAFVTADIVFIKAFGLGIALAIAIDATIIRILLVPATMRLFGDWNWYIPKWLDKLLPKFSESV